MQKDCQVPRACKLRKPDDGSGAILRHQTLCRTLSRLLLLRLRSTLEVVKSTAGASTGCVHCVTITIHVPSVTSHYPNASFVCRAGTGSATVE